MQLNAAAQGGGSAVGQNQLRKRMRALDRRARIWAPFARRMVLRDIVVDGVPVGGPEARCRALGRHWGQ
eukprot:4473522-Pyramimonas_sp.AAC.1